MTLPDGAMIDFSTMSSDEIAQLLWGVQPSEIIPSAPPLGKCKGDKSEVRSAFLNYFNYIFPFFAEEVVCDGRQSKSTRKSYRQPRQSSK